MKNILQAIILFLWEIVDRPLNFLEWLVTDHTGKPSTSRLLLWVWTGFCIYWITKEVSATSSISINAVYLVIISLLGPAISIVMRGASSKDFVAIITAMVGTKAGPVTAKFRGLLKPRPGEDDGV